MCLFPGKRRWRYSSEELEQSVAAPSYCYITVSTSTPSFYLSAGMNFLLINSIHGDGSVLTLTGCSSTSSNRYGPIIPLRPKAHPTGVFSTTRNGRCWCSWGCAWTKMCIFSLLTWPLRWNFALKNMKSKHEDGLRFDDWWFAQRHVSQPCLHWSEVVRSVFSIETGEHPGALYT